jgi:serine/threonine protein kinase
VEGRIVDSKIDIWALGIVVMEILNGGKAPYEDEDGSEERVSNFDRLTEHVTFLFF